MVECRGDLARKNYILSPARGILHGSLGLPKALPGYRRVQFGCSNGFTAHSHAPRLPDIQVKGTSAGNFARLELYNKFARSMNTDDNVSLGASTVF